MTHIGQIAVPRPHPDGQDTLPGLLAQQAMSRGGAVALLHKRHGIWQTWTWQQMAHTAGRWAAALHGLGVAAGDHVVIAGTNRPRLLLAMLACQIRGAVPVLVPQPGAGAGLAQVLTAHAVRVVFAAGEHEVHAIRAMRDTLAHPPQVICDDLRGLRSLWAEWLTDWDDFGTAAPTETFSAAIGPATAAAVVYPQDDSEAQRPIEFNHRALVSAALALAEDHGIGPDDRSVLAVPFAWPVAMLLGPVLTLASGAALAFPESDATVLDDLREIGPTVLSGPPLLFRQIRQAAFRYVAGAGEPWRSWLDRTLGFTVHDPKPPGLMTRILLTALRRRLGLTRLRRAIGTEGAVAPQVAAFFGALGVSIPVFAAPEVPQPDIQLNGSVFIRHAFVSRGNDGVPVALVAPDIDAIALWAQQSGEPMRSTEDVGLRPRVVALLAAEIAALDPAIARFATVQGLTPQTGDLAPDGQVLNAAVERLHSTALTNLRMGFGHPAALPPAETGEESATRLDAWAMQLGIGVL